MKSPAPLAIFRVDASTRVGTGHVMRCLTLANAFKIRGISCAFLSRAITKGLAELVAKSGHTVVELAQDGPPARTEQGEYGVWLGTTQLHDSQSTLMAMSAISPLGCTLLVVDHYGLDADWEKHIRKEINAPLLVIDDLERRHLCDIVLDTTFDKPVDAYNTLVPEKCLCLVGAQFALLRPDFALLRNEALAHKDYLFETKHALSNLLISMGGADADNATCWVLEGLEHLFVDKEIALHVLIGGAFPHEDKLDVYRKKFGDKLVIHRDIRDMAELLATMDLAIGAAGSSAWERCCMGLPSVTLSLAENQRTIASKLSTAGISIDGGTFLASADPKAWVKTHIAPLVDHSKLRDMSETARSVVDGDGVKRVVSAVLSETIRNSTFQLRRAEENDVGLLYEWQLDARTRRFASTKETPTLPEHRAWFSRKVADPGCDFYIVESGGIACGVVRLDKSSSQPPPETAPDNWREISILTAPEFYGCGVASRALYLLREAHSNEVQVARVLSGNITSERLFTRSGFHKYATELMYRSHSQDAQFKL